MPQMASGLKYLEATVNARASPVNVVCWSSAIFVDNRQAGNLGHTRNQRITVSVQSLLRTILKVL